MGSVLPDAVAEAEETVRRAVRQGATEICDHIAAGEKLADTDRETLIRVMRDALSGSEMENDDGDA